MYFKFAHLLTIKLYLRILHIYCTYIARITHACTLLVQLVHLKHLKYPKRTDLRWRQNVPRYSIQQTS